VINTQKSIRVQVSENCFGSSIDHIIYILCHNNNVLYNPEYYTIYLHLTHLLSFIYLYINYPFYINYYIFL